MRPSCLPLGRGRARSRSTSTAPSSSPGSARSRPSCEARRTCACAAARRSRRSATRRTTWTCSSLDSGPGRTPPPPARAHRPPVRSRDGTTGASALDGAVCIGEWRHYHTATHRSRLDTGHGLFSRHSVLRLHGRPTHTSTLRPTDLASTPDRPLQPPLGPGPPRPAVSSTPMQSKILRGRGERPPPRTPKKAAKQRQD